MAVNPYFTFADPALQQAVVNEAQVAAALQAAQAQQRAETQRALRADRQLAADREERRAERDRIISEGQARTTESKRQFDEDLKFRREDAASRTTAATTQRKEAEQREQYAAILRAIEAADGRSLPTAKELEARTADLLPQHRQLLQEARGRRAAQLTSDFGLIAAEAERLNGLIGMDSGDGKKWTADRLLRGSQFKGNLLIGPDGRIQSLAIRPREDVMPGADTPTFHVPIGRPPPDTYNTVEPVADVLGRASGLPGSIRREVNDVSEILPRDSLGRVPSIAGMAPFRVPPPVAPGIGSAGTLAPTQFPFEGPMFRVAPTPSPVMELSPTQLPFEGRIPFRVPARDIGPAGVLAPTQYPFEGSAFRVAPREIDPLYEVNMPFEGRIPFRVPAAPLAEAAPSLIPAEAFDVPVGLMQRGMRLIEAPREAAIRRLSEARKVYPEAELVERPDGVFISPLPRTMFRTPIPGAIPGASDLLAPPVFAPSY